MLNPNNKAVSPMSLMHLADGFCPLGLNWFAVRVPTMHGEGSIPSSSTTRKTHSGLSVSALIGV